jgi:hypothetical protein
MIKHILVMLQFHLITQQNYEKQHKALFLSELTLNAFKKTTTL